MEIPSLARMRDRGWMSDLVSEVLTSSRGGCLSGAEALAVRRWEVEALGFKYQLFSPYLCDLGHLSISESQCLHLQNRVAKTCLPRFSVTFKWDNEQKKIHYWLLNTCTRTRPYTHTRTHKIEFKKPSVL